MSSEAALTGTEGLSGFPGAKDNSVYLRKLSAFSRMLYREGLPVSPKETEDAARILTALDLSERSAVKAALSTVYAKSRDEQAAFDRVFDGFFLPEEAMRAQAAEQMKRERELAEKERQARDELNEKGGPTDLTDEEIRSLALMPEDARQHLREIMETYRPSMGRETKLYTSFIHSVFAKAIMEQQLKMEDADTGVAEADAESGLLFRDISLFKDTEIPKATALIRTITARINGELSAKKKRAAHSGTLDFRRTIRKGLESGGSLYRLQYKKSRHRRKHLVLLCDVSGSMIRFSEFALRFIREMDQVSESSETYLFSEGIFKADPFSLQNMDLFRGYVKNSGLFGRGTDLGSALEYLCGAAPPVLTRSSTLLILSDAKTVDHPRAVRALLKAKTLSGQVLWLNPIPENKWKYLKSSMTYSSICTMLPCSTLRELAAACRRIGAG